MKKTRFFAIAFALLSVLSCQKEEPQVIDNSENGILITCTFAKNDAATRTTVDTDGKTPLWCAGDKIMLYDGSSNAQELTLAASGTASSSTGIINGTDATKFTFVKPSGWTNVYAIYPSSACVSGFSASAPKINFSGQDGTFGKANICAAEEISGTMSFKNVGAILKFTSKSVKAAKVAVPVAGLANNFTVSFSGANPSLASESASNSKEFSIGTGSGAVYIGIPAGSIAASSVFTYKTSAAVTLGTYTTGAANTVEANKIYNLGAMMGTLSGLFTIDGSGNRVQFSKGNLYYTGSAWNFENNQYDYRTYAGKNSCIAGTKSDTGTPTNHWGTFGWSTSSTTYGMSTSISHDYSGDFEDWGKNPIANGGNTADQWRTLSSAEWIYLLNTRTGDNAPEIGTQTDARYAEVKVNGMCGMLIFPDTFTWPEGISTSKPGTFNTYPSAKDWNSVNYTAAELILLESAGCVFLPAAGYRNGTLVDSVGSIGVYWSSTPEGTECAHRLYFNSGHVDPLGNYYRHDAYRVRLVCAAQ